MADTSYNRQASTSFAPGVAKEAGSVVFTAPDPGELNTLQLVLETGWASAVSIYAETTLSAGPGGKAMFDDSVELVLAVAGDEPPNSGDSAIVACAWMWGTGEAGMSRLTPARPFMRGLTNQQWVMSASGHVCRWRLYARPGMYGGVTDAATTLTLDATAATFTGRESARAAERINPECTMPPFEPGTAPLASLGFPIPRRQASMSPRAWRSCGIESAGGLIVPYFEFTVPDTETWYMYVGGGPWSHAWNAGANDTLFASAKDIAGLMTADVDLWGANATNWVFSNQGDGSIIERRAPIEQVQLAAANSTGKAVTIENYIACSWPGGDR